MRSRRDPPSLVFTSTNKVYGDLEDLALDAEGTRYSPSDAAVRRYGVNEAAAHQLPQSLRLFERHGGSVRARLRADVQGAGCGVPNELHLRPASVRDGGSGLGRAFPDQRDRRQDHHGLWRRHAGARRAVRRRPGGRVPAGAGQHALRSPDRRSTSAADRRTPPASWSCWITSRRCTASGPEVDFDAWRAADQRYYVSDTRRFRTATGWAAKTSVPAGLEALYKWLQDARPSAPVQLATGTAAS